MIISVSYGWILLHVLVWDYAAEIKDEFGYVLARVPISVEGAVFES